jgi:hypothetical protein
MDADAAEPLGQPGRSRDVDEKDKTVFLDRGMITPGDEIQEGARSDDVGDPDHQIRQDQEYNRIGDVHPEGLMRRIGRNPRDDVTYLEKEDGNDNRGVDRASHHQVGCERKTAEPLAQRAIQDELRNARHRDTDKQPVRDSHRYPGSRGEPLCEAINDGPDYTGRNDDRE